MDGIIASLITGVLAFAGVVVSNIASNNKMQQQMEIVQAVTDTKLEELTREVRSHNNFAQRVPVLEAKVESLEKQLGIK